MLHYFGNQLALELGRSARQYIFMYEKVDENICFVPFMDLSKGKKRFVKFEKVDGVEWMFVDLVD